VADGYLPAIVPSTLKIFLPIMLRTARKLLPLYNLASRRCYSTAPIQTATAIFREEIGNIQKAGTFKHERVITTAQSSKIGVANGQHRQEVLNFCANNYLGLSNNKGMYIR
jgi:hypothetical protein